MAANDESITELLSPEEKQELLQLREQVQAEKSLKTTEEILSGLELLSITSEKLQFYRQKIVPLLLRLKGVERETALKRVAKTLEVSVKAIREEIAAGSETAASRAWFDIDGSFVPPVLAQHLMQKKYRFVYDRNMLYFYQDGYYKPKGFQFIKARCLGLMENEYRDVHGNEVGKYIETILWNSEPMLDTDARYINVENGLLDWMADPPELLPHNPDYFSSIRIPVRYDPEAACPQIDTFFQDTLPEDCLDLAYELFGYCLLPDTSFQKAFMLLGSGANGKSKFLGLLQAFIGRQNCSAESLQDLGENRFRAASLAGKLVNIFSDLPDKRLEDTALFKALVSGDAISAERKGEQSFEFENHARLVFSANKLPPTKDLSHGFFRRWVIIRFGNSFPEGSPKRDPNILAKITAPEELSGLLNQVIGALVRLFTQKKFSIPASVTAEINAYQNENDNVRIFFEECCELRVGAMVSKDQLYKSYEKWCHAGNYHAISRNKFNTHVKTVYPSVREDTHGIRKWVGIAELALVNDAKEKI
ncbi:hypothetical protein SOV_17260 [Sporomusa ovata DSM 2662]|uniref:DNA primase n=1 Tax=Sporomusa ovata TaxID=2378 RepID=A0A0U1KV99_9FIRM|nr:DNA primase family protein [Sporomusa ovata]EQB29326.1 phage/plasmid primase, P4 family [Sporomusa ovata DSM 2662]CQR71367.1 DNA primase [Sporomusa ovata]